MNRHLSLANRYRPQTFATVIGQNGPVAALSRAAEANRIAPAYLLSGTRGVGKTTIARIFARALNCEHAPAAEPCNTCPQCQHILDGSHVDVCEIDGASNTGVDDVRALRDNLGFMPMQGRYKIFIIDEAHMLSKSAFNALLKTLEEPPAHTVFIFATTEAHRFPATIVSRCQHFVFRHLPEDEILRHLSNILDKEHISYEEAALRLVAKRGAGSMRDSLSLLDQTLALGSDKVDEKLVRISLGLAGQEFFTSLIEAINQGDCAQIIQLCRQLLHSGADIGYFMRELAGWQRNLFLYKQAGKNILPQLDASADEIAQLEKLAASCSPSRLHAAWQMTLEAQRAVAASPEPGAALELLLLNLALLPRLLPVDIFIEKAASQETAKNADEKKKLIEREASTQEPCAGTNPGEENNTDAQAGKAALDMEETRDAFKDRESGSSGDTDKTRWEQFCAFCQTENSGQELPARDLLRGLHASWENGSLRIQPGTALLGERLARKKTVFEKALHRFCNGDAPEITYEEVPQARKHQELMRLGMELPEVRLCKDILGASLTDCREIVN